MKNPIEYLNALAFVRMGGSAEERKAAEMIAEWLREMGYAPNIESFDIQSFKPGAGKLTPLNKRGTAIPIKPVGLSKDGNTSGEVAILDAPEPEWFDAKELHGKIVFMPHYPWRKWLDLLVSGNVAAALTVLPNHREDDTIKMPQTVAKDFGEKIILATIAFNHAIALINGGISSVEVETHCEKFASASQNVVAELPGRSERIIVLTAHYDSTPSSPGAQDNAAGTAELLELAQRLTGQCLHRTLRFIFCGAEEMGLVGSEHHADTNKDALDKVDAIINLDVGGDPFTVPFVRIIGTDETMHYIEGLLRQHGHAAKVSLETYSSDGMPFAKYGVPSISFGRGGIDGKGHSPFDRFENTCNEALLDIANAAETTAKAIADAKLLPFKRAISDELRKRVEEYFIERR